jgi:hypothetical protein|tara:strand:+ start:357 stop:827 length:471 start_codon:yes stop_codon:yes gene_type:complete
MYIKLSNNHVILKKITFIFLILFLLSALIISCSRSKSEARVALENYLVNMKNEEFQKAYDSFSSNIREKCKFEEFQKRASDNYDAIKYSRLVYSGENSNANRVSVDFMIKIDERDVDLFDMQIMDPNRDEETAKFILENERWVLDNLIWPVDWCEK